MTRSAARPTRRTRILGTGAALLLGISALAGCSAHPGQAAIVNYTNTDGVSSTVTISEQEVQDATEDLGEYAAVSGDEGLDAVFVLNALMALPAVEQLGEDYGITVTDADALAALQQIAPDVDYSPAAVDVFRYYLLATQINTLEDQDAVSARFQELQNGLSLDISPRYQGGGAWLLQDDTQLRLG
ncbi:hypothetical protein SAMN05216355_1253 [Actinomyces ruminicola]|uniref:SurA N-terminal domain-containing protein n=1 Tax=Actinomyces ruminicola TaxID=332524 RepID=A0A1H0FC90_9ACTO|nr:hypothetical protein [Actinomyces ruminicola]SDN92255.1 hypothetical protein SAMN05216355_1253 [Actinomyces ruminicola]